MQAIAAIQLSEGDRRDLIQRRAEAVRSAILETGKTAADRLFIVKPKAAGPSAKG